MSRKNYWSNADGLAVGFGTRAAERIVGGVHKTYGAKEEARLDITNLSPSGSTLGANILIPAGASVTRVYMEVGQAFVGGTSITFGDAATANGWITATAGATANLTAGKHIIADGSYAVAATTPTSQQVPKVYAVDTKLFITIAGTFTAGSARIVVEYQI